MGGGKFASLALLRNSTPFSCARDALSLAREFVKCCAIAIAGLQNSKTPRNESKTRGLRLGDRVPEIKPPVSEAQRTRGLRPGDRGSRTRRPGSQGPGVAAGRSIVKVDATNQVFYGVWWHLLLPKWHLPCFKWHLLLPNGASGGIYYYRKAGLRLKFPLPSPDPLCSDRVNATTPRG